MRYEGTTDEWEEVEQGECWLYGTQVKKVRCSDGFGELSEDAFGDDDEDEEDEDEEPDTNDSEDDEIDTNDSEDDEIDTNGSSKWLTIKDGVLTKCDEDAEGVVIIPEGVTKIRGWAFVDCCKKITEIVIPASVTEIASCAFEGDDDEICTALCAITVAGGNKKYKSADGVLYSDGGETLLFYPNGKDDEEFTVPAGVKKIGECAFSDCNALESITLPASITKIGDYALSCESLKQVRYEGTTDEWEEVEQGERWLDKTQVKKVRCSDGFGKLSEDAFGDDDEDEEPDTNDSEDWDEEEEEGDEAD